MLDARVQLNTFATREDGRRTTSCYLQILLGRKYTGIPKNKSFIAKQLSMIVYTFIDITGPSTNSQLVVDEFSSQQESSSC